MTSVWRASHVVLGVGLVASAILAAWLWAHPVSPLKWRFFWSTAGFDVGWSLISFSPTDPMWRVYLVGVVNTLCLAAFAMGVGTALGILLGIARRSTSTIIGIPARAYIELLVNTPFVLQVVAWYFGVFSLLPRPADSLSLGGIAALNNRGLFLARPDVSVAGALWLVAACGGLCIAFFIFRAPATPQAARQRAGRWLALAATAACAVIGLSSIVWQEPVLRGFNLVGGWSIPPALAAMLCALTINNSAYVAEIVRAGLDSISAGQTDAARALGLKPFLAFRLILLPQAVRIVIPPLTSQMQDVLKNCSVAVAIGFPDLVALWMNITLNQTGRAVEILATTVLFYVLSGFSISLLLAWYRGRRRWL